MIAHLVPNTGFRDFVAALEFSLEDNPVEVRNTALILLRQGSLELTSGSDIGAQRKTVKQYIRFRIGFLHNSLLIWRGGDW
jgi:hypothetical protein